MRSVNLTKRIEQNRIGRDFVVGDVHGCFRTLERLLVEVDFQPETDRLFSVGDLIDRGPHSLEAIHWLVEGRIHAATMGNHENALVGYLWGRSTEVYESWWESIATHERTLWIRTLRTMPLALTIKTRHGDVGIVHAGLLRRSWQATVEALESENRKASIEVALLGGEDLLGPNWRGPKGAPVRGARAIVTGHEIHAGPILDGNWWRIDTGAGMPGGRLTMLQIECDPLEATTVDVVRSEQVAAKSASNS